MTTETLIEAPKSRFQRISNLLLALCLGVMAVAVFVNVVLRYGFGSGVRRQRRAVAPAVRLDGVHRRDRRLPGRRAHGLHQPGRPAARPAARCSLAMTLLIRLLVLLGCALIGWGAWQQVVVGLDSHSVVLGYPTALLPLPALLCATAIGLMALFEIIKRTPLDLGHGAEVE